MSSVLAIVSKALFEKMVPKDVAVGALVDTDQYVSANAAFAQLGKSDAIFLVTVRPPDEKLWLIGILEAPKQAGKAWKSAGNKAPIGDITSAIPKLSFESGTGLKAKKGALGMSLQTPRLLTPADVKLLRGLVPKKSTTKVKASKEYAEAVATGSKKAAKAPAPTAKAGKPADMSKLGTLRLENYRKPFEQGFAALSATDKKQMQALLDRGEDTEGMTVKDAMASDDEELFIRYMEWFDVVDNKTNKPVAQMFLYPFGDGAIVKYGTTSMLADICQHDMTAAENVTKAWVADFDKAWREGAKRLGASDPGHFSVDVEAGADGDED